MEVSKIELVVILTLALITGWAFGMYDHPYEQCKRIYTTPEDIDECVWIKQEG